MHEVLNVHGVFQCPSLRLRVPPQMIRLRKTKRKKIAPPRILRLRTIRKRRKRKRRGATRRPRRRTKKKEKKKKKKDKKGDDDDFGKDAQEKAHIKAQMRGMG